MAKLKLNATETKEGIIYTVKKYKSEGVVSLQLKQEGSDPILQDFTRDEIKALGIFLETAPAVASVKKGSFPEKYKMANGHTCILKSQEGDEATYETKETGYVKTITKQVIDELVADEVITLID